MRHGVKKSKLGKTYGHRRALLKNLATSVIKQGLNDDQVDRQVKTTVQKAKAVRPLVERLITYAKKGDLTSRRQAARFIQEPAILQELFNVVGPRYKEREGGYTRILKISESRVGDASQMALVSLVENEMKAKAKNVAPAAKAEVDSAE